MTDVPPFVARWHRAVAWFDRFRQTHGFPHEAPPIDRCEWCDQLPTWVYIGPGGDFYACDTCKAGWFADGWQRIKGR